MRTRDHGDHGTRRRPIGRAALLSVLLLSVSVGPAGAAFTNTAECLALKLKEWGKLRRCEANENAKAIRSLPADPAKCGLKHQAKLTLLSAQALVAGIDCRFRANGDGTVIDYDTGLQWEQKTDDGGIHDKDVAYSWSFGIYWPDFTYPDGSLFIDFLSRLNDCPSENGATATGGFAGHCDWHLPTLPELLGMADLSEPGCMTLTGVCIDVATFGPVTDTNNAPNYWSSSVLSPTPSFPNMAWGVDFRLASPFLATRNSAMYARAVRRAL